MCKGKNKRGFRIQAIDRLLRRKGVSRLEMVAAGIFWLFIPGATAILSAYFTYRLGVIS